MIHKIKNRIKNEIEDIKNNPKQLIWYIICILIIIGINIPVPYYVTIGGGALEIEDKIIVESSYEKEGSFNLAYVSEVKGNVLFYLLSYVVPTYEKEKIEDVVIDNEDVEDYNFREKLYFKESLSSATYVAYTKAGKTIEEKESNLYVVYIDETSETDIKVQDKVIKVNGDYIYNKKDLTNILDNYNIGDTIEITVLRDDKEVVTNSKIIEMDNEKKIGIYIIEEKIYDTDPSISFKFSSKESGPSGGLTTALNIYNKLVEEDITKGKKIVGTGTIDEDGNVGEIGGVKYKLIGAVKAKADLFIVPKENYEEAVKIKEEKGYDIDIICVSTFDEAIEKLSNLK